MVPGRAPRILGIRGVRRRRRSPQDRARAHGAAPETGAIPEMPTIADPATGFAPRGASVERGGPEYPFTILERDRAASPTWPSSTQQAVAAQWSADRDIPWGKARALPPRRRARARPSLHVPRGERARGALRPGALPPADPSPLRRGGDVPRNPTIRRGAAHRGVPPARALHGALGISSPATSRSLLSLLETQDFTEAAFLLTVLGEGTFLDLLRFLERHAPDECTSELLRRARADESRHVHFGLAHVRRAMEGDPQLCGRLERAVARRAATLHGIDGVPPPVQDALVVFAAGSAAPGPLARGKMRSESSSPKCTMGGSAGSGRRASTKRPRRGSPISTLRTSCENWGNPRPPFAVRRRPFPWNPTQRWKRSAGESWIRRSCRRRDPRRGVRRAHWMQPASPVAAARKRRLPTFRTPPSSSYLDGHGARRRGDRLRRPRERGPRRCASSATNRCSSRRPWRRPTTRPPRMPRF